LRIARPASEANALSETTIALRADSALEEVATETRKSTTKIRKSSVERADWRRERSGLTFKRVSATVST
jgi:hypothetical protein